MKQIARTYPRFSTCSVNNCPLDPNPCAIAEDKEPRCTMAKSIRMRLAGATPGALPRGGLTKREYGSTAWFARLSPTSSAAVIERLKGYAFRVTSERRGQLTAERQHGASEANATLP